MPAGRSVFSCSAAFAAADVSGTNTRIVVDVSPRWGGRAAVGALELRPSGTQQRPIERGQTLHSTTKTIMEKEETP